MKAITINLRDLGLSGSILDISYKGSFIIPEMIETYTKDKIEKEFLECEDEIACTASAYNNAVAILSFNSVFGKRNLSRIINDVQKSLINGGRFIICDLDLKAFSPPSTYNIILKLPEEKIMQTKYTLGVNPFRPNFKDVAEISEKCGFSILNKRVEKGAYYLECLKE